MPRPDAPTLRTARLLLRPWRAGDRAEFAVMNADAEVMAHFPAPLDRCQSDALVDHIQATFRAKGFGLWAVEVPSEAPFIGFVGLNPVPFEAAFTPAVEVGWRLARRHWRKGYATEAGTAAVEYGFDQGGLKEVVSFTTLGNRRSRAVMERLGMTHDPTDDFEHPNLAADDPLRPHVLYRLR